MRSHDAVAGPAHRLPASGRDVPRHTKRGHKKMKPMLRLLAAAGILTALGLPAEAVTKIGIVVETLGNPYFACLKKAAEEEAAKHSDVDLSVIGAATGTDLAGMTRMIEDLTQAKVDVLAFNAVDPNAMISTAKKAQAAGIKVLIHSDDLAEQVASHFVGPDQYAGQAAVARIVASALGGKGSVAILEGVPGNMSSLLRKKGAEETLAKYPGIQIIGVWAANWDRAQGLQKAEDILTAHPDVSAIIAVNDEMAFGALQAVKARNLLGKVIVTGFNGVPEAIQAVYRGDLLATVLTYCDAVGRQLVLTGMEVAAGTDDKTYTVDTGTIPLDTKLVTTIGGALGVK
jgi:ribose transport system substrate-binding protein